MGAGALAAGRSEPRSPALGRLVSLHFWGGTQGQGVGRVVSSKASSCSQLAPLGGVPTCLSSAHVHPCCLLTCPLLSSKGRVWWIRTLPNSLILTSLCLLWPCLQTQSRRRSWELGFQHLNLGEDPSHPVAPTYPTHCSSPLWTVAGATRPRVFSVGSSSELRALAVNTATSPGSPASLLAVLCSPSLLLYAPDLHQADLREGRGPVHCSFS